MTAVLYAARAGSATASDLYTVDSATAAVTSLGASGFAITGLAEDPTNGTLYGVTSPNSAAHPKSIITLDTTIGAGTFVVALSPAHTVADIAFHSSGQLYGWDQSAAHGRLAAIDKATGVVTGAPNDYGANTGGDGMSIDGTDVLWGLFISTNSRVDTVDLTTGVKTSVIVPLNDAALFSPLQRCQAASFDGDGLLWGIYNSEGVGKLNVSTGVWADVGLPGGISNWDALAWATGAGGGGGTGAQPEGVSISFTDPTLEPAPTWVRLDT